LDSAIVLQTHRRCASRRTTSPASGGTPRAGLDTILKAIGDESVGGRVEPLDILTIQEVQSQGTTRDGGGEPAEFDLRGRPPIRTARSTERPLCAGTQGVVFNTHQRPASSVKRRSARQ